MFDFYRKSARTLGRETFHSCSSIVRTEVRRHPSVLGLKSSTERGVTFHWGQHFRTFQIKRKPISGNRLCPPDAENGLQEVMKR